MFAEAEAARARGDFDRLVDLAVQIWVDGPGQPAERVPQDLRERIREMFAADLSTDERRRRLPPRPPEPPAADIMAERIPGARKAVMQGCAHMLNMERTDGPRSA